MAGCRVLACRSFISNVVTPNQSQACLSSSTHQPYTVTRNHQKINKKPYEKQDLWCPVRCCTSTQSTTKYDWQNNVLLITGASKGIGSQIVRMSLEEGVKQVVNLDDDPIYGLGLQTEMNMKYGGADIVKFIKCDLNDEEQIKERFESVLEDKENTYVVINNAGILDNSLQHFKKQIDVNVGALVAGSLTALELMRKDNQGQGGAIINISSVAALCPLPLTPIYNAAKSAILTFSIGLGNQDLFLRTGVRVMTVCFGSLNTELTDFTNASSFDKETADKLATDLHSWPGQTPEAAARAVIDAFKQGETGSTWLSNANKPAENITHIAMKAYSLLSQRSPL